MTQEWILKTLMELGFKQEEAEIYLLLTKGGPKKASEISNELKIYRRKVYRILKKLEKNLLVKTKSTYFQIVPFDNFLDSIIQNCLTEASQLENEKPVFFAKWKLLQKDRSIDDNNAKF